MFYCNECADKKGYPRTYSKSYGMCEVCREVSSCNDLPSGCLSKYATLDRNCLT